MKVKLENVAWGGELVELVEANPHCKFWIERDASGIIWLYFTPEKNIIPPPPGE